jgi:Ca-activated chloride channel homolog
MKSGVWLVCVAMFSMVTGTFAYGQSVRSLVNGGNGQYNDQQFTDAEVNYRKALEKEPDLVQGRFNLGDALYKQGKLEESVKEFEAAAAKAESKVTRAHAYHNIGNALLKAQQYQDAVNAYIESLKLNPGDQETKYNLSYALEKLKTQQQQQQQNKNNKNQDKNKENSQDKNEQRKQDQQKQDQQKQNQQKQESQTKEKQAQQEKQMSKTDAERILEVLKNSEKDVQKKLRTRQAVRAKTEKDW